MIMENSESENQSDAEVVNEIMPMRVSSAW